MKKNIYFGILIFVLLGFIKTGRADLNDGLIDYFPVSLGSTWTYSDNKSVYISNQQYEDNALHITISDINSTNDNLNTNSSYSRSDYVDLEITQDAVSHRGYSNPDFPFVSGYFSPSTLLKFPLNKNSTWNHQGNSNGYTVYISSTITNTDINVMTNNELFSNCIELTWKIGYPEGYNWDNWLIERKIYFARNVGIIKRIDTWSDGSENTIEIVSYDISGENQSNGDNYDNTTNSENQFSENQIMFDLPYITVSPDGYADDWGNIAPVSIDHRYGDNECDESKGDLSALYLAQDESNIYWRVDNWEGTFKETSSNYSPRCKLLLFPNGVTNTMEKNVVESRVYSEGSLLFKNYGNQWNRILNADYGAINKIVEGQIPKEYLLPIAEYNKVQVEFSLNSWCDIFYFNLYDYDVKKQVPNSIRNTQNNTKYFEYYKGNIILDIPSYTAPTDLYIAFQNSSGKLLFLNSNDELTIDFLPYAVASKSAVKRVITMKEDSLYHELYGDCGFFWLVAPTNGGDLLSSIENEAYELGYYGVNLPNPEEEFLNDILDRIKEVSHFKDARSITQDALKLSGVGYPGFNDGEDQFHLTETGLDVVSLALLNKGTTLGEFIDSFSEIIRQPDGSFIDKPLFIQALNMTIEKGLDEQINSQAKNISMFLNSSGSLLTEETKLNSIQVTLLSLFITSIAVDFSDDFETGYRSFSKRRKGILCPSDLSGFSAFSCWGASFFTGLGSVLVTTGIGSCVLSLGICPHGGVLLAIGGMSTLLGVSWAKLYTGALATNLPEASMEVTGKPIEEIAPIMATDDPIFPDSEECIGDYWIEYDSEFSNSLEDYSFRYHCKVCKPTSIARGNWDYTGDYPVLGGEWESSYAFWRVDLEGMPENIDKNDIIKIETCVLGQDEGIGDGHDFYMVMYDYELDAEKVNLDGDISSKCISVESAYNDKADEVILGYLKNDFLNIVLGGGIGDKAEIRGIRVDLSVSKPEPLTATINAPVDNEITVGDSILFNGIVSGGVEPYTYYWDFDGAAENSDKKDPGYITFLEARTYNISFKVTDFNGTSNTDTRVITVAEAPEDVDPLNITIKTASVLSFIDGSTSIKFEGIVSGGVEPYTYHWDFDGAAENSDKKDPGLIPIDRTRSWNISFTVTDFEGNSVTEYTVIAGRW